MNQFIQSLCLMFTFYSQIETIHFLTNENNALQKNGSAVKFDCSVDEWSQNNVVSIKWSKGYNLMTSYDRFPKEKYQQSKTVMLFEKARPRDSGRYECKIKTTKGILNRTFDIPPTKAPHIIKFKDTNRNVNLDGEAKFKCLVSPYFTSSYTWLYQGKELIPKSGYSDFKVKKYQFLKIRKATIKDQGVYTCSVTNAIGRSEVSYYLNVKGHQNHSLDLAPRIKRNISTMVDIVMNEMKLDCTSTGEPPFTVSWFKDGVPIKVKPRINGAQYKYANNQQVLVLHDLVPSDKGIFTCVVKNKYGSYRHNMEVDPIEKIAKEPFFLNKVLKGDGKPFPAVLGENLTVFAHIALFGTAHIQMLRIVNNGNGTSNSSSDQSLQVLNIPRKSHLILNRDKDQYFANDYKIEFYFVNVSKKDLGPYTIMAGNTIGFDVYHFFISEKNESIEEFPKKTDISLITVSSKKDPWTDSPIFIVLISAVLIIILTLIVLIVRKVRTDKIKNENNNKFTYNKEMEAVILNIDSNKVTTRLSSSSFSKRAANSARLSSSKTEKEYFTIPFDQEWEVEYDNIELKGILGEGAFGRVMLANVHGLRKDTSLQTVAVKMLKEDAHDQELKDLLSEIQVMKSFGKHTNIINLLGISSQSGELCLIMEYCRYGNLRQFLKQRRPVISPLSHPIEELTLVHLTSFCLQVAKGMDYLASQKCIHRDIAARNVLVSDDYVLKIADFGLARDVHDRDYYRKFTDGRLPVKWMAMEALFDRVYTVQSDIWSFGILAWEILTFGGSPYPGIPLERLFDLLKQGYRMEKPINCTDEMYAIMLNCWKEIPIMRPTFADIVDSLEAMIIDLGTSDYLDLQPPYECSFPTESNSTTPPSSPLSLSTSQPSVFDEQLKASEEEERDRLLLEDTSQDSYADLHTKL